MMSSPSKDLFLGSHLNLEFTFPEFECVESTYTRKFDGGILIVAMSGITHLHSYASPSSSSSSSSSSLALLAKL